MPETIQLIVLTPVAVDELVDRGGGEPHGLIKTALGKAARAIPYEEFATKLEDVVVKVQEVAHRLRTQLADYEPEEITIGLAVSAEGDIGVATAGVEASIEVTFKRRGRSKFGFTS